MQYKAEIQPLSDKFIHQCCKGFFLLCLFSSMLLIAPAETFSKTKHSKSSTPDALIKALKTRSREIKSRKKKLVAREKQLAMLKKEVLEMLDQVTLKLEKISQVKKEILQIEVDKKNAIKQSEEDKIIKLAKIYQGMPPKVAAARLEKMNESTSIQLFQRFKAAASAKILAKMDSKKAARISENLLKKK